MNYGGNISDWHQYNSVQTNVNEATSTDHNVNANRLAFMSSGSPSSLNPLNTEGYKKYQNEANFSSRHFPPMNNVSNGSNNTDNFAMSSVVQMQGYIGQYGPVVNRNSVMDSVKAPVDMRNGSMNTLNDDYRYRNSHMALPGQNSHVNGSNMNINAPVTSMGSRTSNMCAASSVRQGPSSFIPCKALCCNPNTNIGYQQWDKFGTYQSNTPYRENMRLPGYQADNRQYSDHNFRKDNFENKEMLNSIIPNTDHRRNFPEYKYNKDSTMSRSCSGPSGMIQNYPIPNYNYPAEYQKYSYPMKEYSKTNNMGLQDATVFKHPEQNYIAQPKYNAKQGQYATGNVLPKTVPTLNDSVDITSTQNSYYAAQFIRNVPTEYPRTCQKAFDNSQQVTAMQSTPVHSTSSRYHSYQQKIAMQRFSMENHLREFTRIPGYQSHPKYKESVLRYREILKLQQSHGYPAAVQHPVRIASTPVDTIPSINLQFDQNGVLINPTYLSDSFPKTQQHTLNADSKHLEKQEKEQDLCPSDLSNENNLHPKQSVNHSSKEHSSSLYPNDFQNQDQLLIQKCSEQTEFKIQESAGDGINSNNADTITEQEKTSKDFADKPNIDVRQFLANWDASEDEDDSNANLPHVVLSDSTSLVVVEYESIDSPSKIPHNVNVNKENITCSKKHDKVTQEYSQSLDSPSHSTETLQNLTEYRNKDITKSGNIIHCITNNTDDIPTIHIVDNVQINNILEVSNDQIIETLEHQGSIPFYRENVNLEEEIRKCDDDKKDNSTNIEALNKDTYTTDDNLSEKDRKSSIQNTNQELNALESVSKSNLNGQNTNLPKQSSFTSEESHNTDDISLPDLPTTECTPISTTLNTPIHSDSEEQPSGRESSISSNPIEIIQNSPIISFTHSPIKIGSYEHLDDTAISKENTLLQFNLEEANQSNNNSINAFENTIASNNFNKSDNSSKSEVIEACRSNKLQTSSNKNSTIMNTKQIDKKFNEKSSNVCDSSTNAYESESVPIDMHKNSMQISKNTKVDKINSDKFQNIEDPSEPINYKISTTLNETSQSTFKNKSSENKQQYMINTVQNNDKSPEINIETRKQSKCSFATKLKQDIPNDKSPISLISGEHIEEGHTLVQYTEKNTSSNIKNILSIPNINIYASRADKLQNINTVSIQKRCLDTLTNNKLHSKSPQNLCASKEKDREDFSKDFHNEFKHQELTKDSDVHSSSINNAGLMNLEISPGHITLHKKSPILDTKSNTKLENDIINKKEDNEHIFAKQGKSISISKKIHGQLQKSDEICKINANADITNVSQGDHNQSKILEKKKSQKNFNVDNIINNTKKRDFNEYMETNNDVIYLDKCIDNNKHIENNYFNKKSTSQYIDQFQQCDSAIEDTQALEKNTNLKNKVDSSQIPSSTTTICSITSEKSEQEQLYTVSKSFTRKNVNPDFEIKVTNVNLKFTDNDICKELVSLRDRKQENLNNCSDGIKIEINVMCAERNAKEKLLQQESINMDSEMIDQSYNSVYSNKSTCLSNIKEYDIYGKLDTEKGSNKIDEIINHNRSQSTDICYETVENIMEEQEEPLSLIVRNKTVPTNKENSLPQEFSKGNETPSKDILSRSKNSMGDNNYTEIDQETISVNTFNERKKQHTLLNLVDKPNDAKDENLCCAKMNDLLNNINQENEPSNVIYSCVTSNVNYMQNNANSERISKMNNMQTNKMEDPSSTSYKYKDKKNEEDDSSSDKNDDMPNIVTIHVKTDNMNNEKFSELDFTNFDLFSNESNKSNDNEPGKWRRPITPIVNQTLEECDLYGSTSGYVNPIFTNIEESNNRNEIPVYRTKDGKITYSPNPKALFLENKERAYCTVEEYSPHKYNNHLKMNTSVKKEKNIKERIPLESNDTKITWSESTDKNLSEYPNKNENSKKNVHSTKHQVLDLKHYYPKIEKQYNSTTDNQVHREYNKDLSDFKREEHKQYSNEDNYSIHKDSFKNEATKESESHKKKLKDIFDSNINSEQKNMKKAEKLGVTEAYTMYHNTRNNNSIQKSSHNDTFSLNKSTDSFVEKPSSTESCDIKSKYCDTIKESIVPYAICDQSVTKCSLNQSNNLTSEKSNSIMKLEKKKFKPNINQLKSSELCLENRFKGKKHYTNNLMKHNSFSEDLEYLNEKKIDPNIIHLESENICTEVTKKSVSPITSEISTYKRHYDDFHVKCEIGSDESNENFEAEFENTRDILKYAKENIVVSKKDVLLTTTLDVKCSDSLKQLNSTEQKEKIEYQDESNGETENTNFSLQNEVSKNNEDENLNQQITEANIFYTDNNIISEKGWRRLPSNCLKNDEIEIMGSDIINPDNFDSEVHIIHGESMHISQMKKSKMPKIILETDESSFNESNNDCQNHNFITTDHKYDTPFSGEEKIKSEPIYMSQNKDEIILLESVVCNKNIDTIEEINKDKSTEKKNIENSISSFNSINNSETKNIIKDEDFSPNNINEIDIVEGPSLKQKDINISKYQNYNLSDIINTSQESSETSVNSIEKESQRKQLNDYLYCIENKSNNSSYLSLKQSKNCDIKACNTPELDNISKLNLEKNTNVINEITTNDINNKVEEERSLSPPDITTTAYINTNYSSTSDYNTNIQMVSRTIIEENETNTNSKPELSSQPKIPKMIIRNTGSCSTTSVAEEISETSSDYPSFAHSKVKHSTFIIENEKDKGRSDSDSESSLHKYDLNKSRVPKMKIKFNDKSSKRNIEGGNMEISFKRKHIKKIVPKVKIKKIRTETTMQNEPTKSSLLMMEVETSNTTNETSSNQISIVNEEKKQEKIPKLKLKKSQEIILPMESLRKKINIKTVDSTVKKYKYDKNEIKSTKKHEDIIESTLEQNDNSSVSEREVKHKLLPCISEKVPKVIIKRASASAEFKCEFSEGDSDTIMSSSKWQPEVKLQRSRHLDNMVKDLKYCRISKAYITRKCIDIISSHRSRKLIKSYGFQDKRHDKLNKLYKSNSVSDLCPIKYEENRKLNYNYSNNKLSDTEVTPILEGIEKHNELSIKSISKYKFEKNLWNIDDKYREESYVSNDIVYKNSSDKDNMDHSIIKADITNITNNTTLKNNADNSDLSTINFNANSTNNVSKISLITQNDLIHYNDNENKFTRENNEPETKPLKSDIATDDSADNDCSVIKLDSSDESQSTIEILPASPDINQIGIEEPNNLNNEESEQLYSEDAIPTQFELELEVTDSNIDSVEASPLRHELNSEHFNDIQLRTWQLNQKIQNFNDLRNYTNQDVPLVNNNQQSSEVSEKNKLSSKQNISSISIRTDDSSENHTIETTVTSRENLCCNDLLVKEVLAAKEMLKKCLSISKNDITLKNKSKLRSLIETNKDSCLTSSSHTKTFLKTVTTHHTYEIDKINQQRSTNELNIKKIGKKNCNEVINKVIQITKCTEKKDIRHTDVNVQSTLVSAQNSPVISLKTLKRYSQSVPNKNMSTNTKYRKILEEDGNEHSICQSSHTHQVENKVQDVKVEKNMTHPKIETTSDDENVQIEDDKNCNQSSKREDNMPILEPEIAFSFDGSSDRDSSRSPPVITNQEIITTQNEILKCLQGEVLASNDKKDDNKKYITKEYDMTVNDIVTQLAYHKKSTIRHKRYCNLCEKWFPTTSRHRRHLAGYQHRHIELTQRRAIHALFILFTGKPCSKLLRATSMRDDCSIGELTPLQIAIQDLAKYLDGAETDLLIPNNVEK